MKIILQLWLVGLVCHSLQGQNNIQESFPATQFEILKGNFTWGNIHLKAWNEDRIEITGTASINMGENDDAFILDIDENDNILSIRADVDDVKKIPKMITVWHEGQKYRFRKEGDSQEMKEKIKAELGINNVKMYSEGVDIEVYLEIKVPQSIALDIQSTYGNIEIIGNYPSVDIENTYGHIDATFTKPLASGDISLISTYAFVDVELPSDASREIDMRTQYGRLYTNLDIAIDPDRSSLERFDNHVVGTINRGGDRLKLASPYGKVYLRKN